MGLKIPKRVLKKVLKARGCLSKKRFATEAEAQADCDLYNQRNGALPGHALEPYHCKYYAHWHLGHSRY